MVRASTAQLALYFDELEWHELLQLWRTVKQIVGVLKASKSRSAELATLAS